MLGGKCRSCRARITFQYPLIELVSGLIWVFAPTPFAIAALELLLVVAVIDYQDLIIPDGLVIALAVVAGVFGRISLESFLAALGTAGFFGALWLISKGRWIGFGDVKLGGALGLAFGFPGVLYVVYLAVVGGGLMGLLLILLRRATMKTKLPLGTLLAVAGGVVTFLPW